MFTFTTRTCQLALAAFAICFGNRAIADDLISCNPDFYLEARSMSALPDAIRFALTNAPRRQHEISDPGGPFNLTDLGPGPYRRLIMGAIGPKHVIVELEQGGLANFVEIWSFWTENDGWSRGVQTVPHERPQSLKELVGIACK